MGITTGGFNFENTIFDGQKGNIESTTSEIEDEDVSFTLALSVETISNSGSCGLVNNSEDVKTTDGTSILGSLSLRIVEIGRNSDNSILNGLVEESFSSFLHLGKDHR
mmetsp:Transcript_20083/g.17205  ORF Transcript_20083/g.17205 Transcript_20083/m.17205 type:complete len:108 (-) Transcript_20083:418-741(-)